jgi:hypothetical protein
MDPVKLLNQYNARKIGSLVNFYLFERWNFVRKIKAEKPGPASAVEELRTMQREDPGSTPDES